MNQSLRRLIVTAAAVAPVAALIAAAPLPHLKLKRAFPAADTTLTSSPDAVKLWLTEATDPATSSIVVTKGGAPVATAKLTRGATLDDPLTAKFSAAPGDGAYTVTWKAMSKDGHVVNGTYGFTVKVAK
ncbi:MAG: copper resistance protein CopC [Gemmatimonadetes bacterium]|nr:copper resistance protein CopC [Gemmatimonadota bacterium]